MKTEEGSCHLVKPKGPQVGRTTVFFGFVFFFSNVIGCPILATQEVVFLGKNACSFFPPSLSFSLRQFLFQLPSSARYESRLNLPQKPPPPPEPGDAPTPHVPERVSWCGNEEILSPPDSNKTPLAPDFRLHPPEAGANPPLCRASSTVAGLIATPGCFPRC